MIALQLFLNKLWFCNLTGLLRDPELGYDAKQIPFKIASQSLVFFVFTKISSELEFS